MNTLEQRQAFAQIPWQQRYPETSTYQIFCNSAQRFPEHVALQFLLNGDTQEKPLTFTYQQLLAHINRTANMLSSFGVDTGAAVAIILPNLPHTHFALWGSQALGIAVPINPMLEARALNDIMLAADVQAVICLGPIADSDIWQKTLQAANCLPDLKCIVQVNPFGKPKSDDEIATTVKGVPIADFDTSCLQQPSEKLTFKRTILPEDIAAYFHTGGTTGMPKLAQHTHANQIFMSGTVADITECHDQMVALAGLPLFHVNAVFATGLNLFRCGACALYATPNGYRNKVLLKHFWQIIENYRVNYFSAVPTILTTLLNIPKGDADLSQLEFVVCGAAPLSPGLFRQFRDYTGVELVEGYGLTEGTCSSTLNPIKGEKRIGSIGLPMPYQALRTVMFDQDGEILRDCEPGETGELMVSGPNVFAGYKQQSKNKGVLMSHWLRTGDLARVDQSGFVWLTGRAKDLIIRGGHNIDPSIIEDCLVNHPSVELAAAVGQPDSYAGELPCAFVTLKPESEVSAEELVAYTRQHIVERAAVPVSVGILPVMPVTTVGKIFKPELRLLATQKALQKMFDEQALRVDFAVENCKEVGTMINISASDNIKATMALLENLPFVVKMAA